MGRAWSNNTRTWCLLVFFFFQAEDGIRDVAVTGVQTCALPILVSRLRLPLEHVRVVALSPDGRLLAASGTGRNIALVNVNSGQVRAVLGVGEINQIGRASCRERV